VSRALAYCAFLQQPEISLPRTGVKSSEVRVMCHGRLRLLWSDVPWPFQPGEMQKNAVEFHGVVHHVFRQSVVVPFRLLSIFQNERELTAFAVEHAEGFIADLERLGDFVQMECVVYPAPGRAFSSSVSGAAYLRERAGLLQMIEQQVAQLREQLRGMAHEIRVRETRSGTRLFILMERGREKEFRPMMERMALPDQLSRRMSGPWPPAEFLSERVKAPQVKGQ
jgi:gas vesicle protein GvpL/GvpF